MPHIQLPYHFPAAERGIHFHQLAAQRQNRHHHVFADGGAVKERIGNGGLRAE